MKADLLLRVGTKLVMPFILLFALYVQLHGDYGPGGGFQAGVISAAMIVLYGLVFGLNAAKTVAPQVLVERMMPAGALLYASVGLIGMIHGDNYLNYAQIAHDPVHGHEWGILLVEAGVLITVSSTMIAIFYTFAERGRP